MKEVIIKLTSDHIKVKGGEYVQNLVRCGNCKWWKQIIGAVGECESDYMWSTLAGEITEVSSIDRNADDFCSYGEVRDE